MSNGAPSRVLGELAARAFMEQRDLGGAQRRVPD